MSFSRDRSVFLRVADVSFLKGDDGAEEVGAEVVRSEVPKPSK